MQSIAGNHSRSTNGRSSRGGIYSRRRVVWPNDNVHRHLQIWETGARAYCAIEADDGSLVTFAGESPGGTGAVTAGVTGRLNGGWVFTIPSGTLNPSPAYKTHGELGTLDLQCDMTGNCPGAHPSYSSYVDGSSTYTWGWSYHTAQNGDWVNSDTGNSGDITG